MKITSNLNNFQTKQIERKGQQSPIKTENEQPKIGMMSYSQSIAFAGIFSKETPAEKVHRKIIDQLEKIRKIKWTKSEKEIEEFTKLIQSPDFEYDFKISDDSNYRYNVGNDIDVCKILNLKSKKYDANTENLLMALKTQLHIEMLNKEGELPEGVKKYFDNPKNISEFLEQITVLFNVVQDEKSLDKAFDRLKKEFGIDINQKLKEDGACLNFAVLYEDAPCVKYLLSKGATPFDGNESIISEAQSSSVKAIKELFSDKNMILHCINNSIFDNGFINLLKSSKVDFNNIDGNGTSLETAIKTNCKDEKALKQIMPFVENLKIQGIIKEEISENDKKLLNMAKNKMSQAVQVFLADNTVNINARNEDGNTALQIAASNDDVSLFRLLAKHPDIDFSLVNKEGDSLGIIASKNNSLKILDELSKNPPKDFNPNHVNILGKSTTNMLNSAKTPEALEKILQFKNIDVNSTDLGIEPAIIHFAKQGDYNNLKLIALHPTTDLSIKDKEGKTVFDIIDKIEDNEIKNEFILGLRAVKDKKVLEDARKIMESYGTLTPEAIKAFLEYPNIAVIINEPISENGETLAHYLHEYKLTSDNIDEMVSLYENFIKANPDINKQDKYLRTPLMNATNAQNLFAIEFLLKNGADKTLKNIGGETAEDMARDSKNEDLKRIFEENS